MCLITEVVDEAIFVQNNSNRHAKEGLDIKSISQLYMEAHTVSHVRTRIQGNSSVNNAVNSSLEQESCWTTKKSTIVECEASYLDALIQCAPGGDVPELNGNNQLSSRSSSMPMLENKPRQVC